MTFLELIKFAQREYSRRAETGVVRKGGLPRTRDIPHNVISEPQKFVGFGLPGGAPNLFPDTRGKQTPVNHLQNLFNTNPDLATKAMILKTVREPKPVAKSPMVAQAKPVEQAHTQTIPQAPQAPLGTQVSTPPAKPIVPSRHQKGQVTRDPHVPTKQTFKADPKAGYDPDADYKAWGKEYENKAQVPLQPKTQPDKPQSLTTIRHSPATETPPPQMTTESTQTSGHPTANTKETASTLRNESSNPMHSSEGTAKNVNKLREFLKKHPYGTGAAALAIMATGTAVLASSQHKTKEQRRLEIMKSFSGDSSGK